jgi:23S rRNA pseudouridine1911/1915/1917 synthase
LQPAAGPSAAADAAPRVVEVPLSLAGERLDKALAQLFPEFSRSRLQSWIEAQRVLIDGAPAKIRQPVPLGAKIELVPDLLPEQLAFAAEPVPLDVIYEDDALVVINKPAGLVVHPAAGNWSGTLLNGLLHRYGDAAAGLPRAGIVHRLDKETSGLMVVARTLAAQTDLVRQLQAHGEAPLLRARVGHHARGRHDRRADRARSARAHAHGGRHRRVGQARTHPFPHG